jgi:hypothetical protein
MPFTGFRCEATHPESATVSAEHCLACARGGALPGCALTAPVVKGILGGLRDDGFGLTVTTLLDCPRKHRLRQSEPYTLKPSEAWWAYRGQLLHNVAAEYARDDPQAIAERRFSLLWNGVTISGQPDLVYVDRQHLVDFKTTKAVPRPVRVWLCPTTQREIGRSAFARRGRKPKCPECGEAHLAPDLQAVRPPRPYLRHVQQVSLYRLILWENGLEIHTAEIVYQDMRRQLRLPVELLSLAATQALLDARLALHQQPDLPPVLTAPKDLWECDYCPVRAACEAQAKRQGARGR